MAGLEMCERAARVLREQVNIRFPNGEIRAFKKGPAAALGKAVIEVFAPRFLLMPVVVRAGLPGSTSVPLDYETCRSLRFNTDGFENLPDIVLDDLGN